LTERWGPNTILVYLLKEGCGWFRDKACINYTLLHMFY